MIITFALSAPHRACLADPVLTWLMLVGHIVIFAAYLAIPLAIHRFSVDRGLVGPARQISLLFKAFVLACGVTHLLTALTLFWPVYRTEILGIWITAAVSAVSAVVAWRSLHRWKSASEDVRQVAKATLGAVVSGDASGLEGLAKVPAIERLAHYARTGHQESAHARMLRKLADIPHRGVAHVWLDAPEPLGQMRIKDLVGGAWVIDTRAAEGLPMVALFAADWDNLYPLYRRALVGGERVEFFYRLYAGGPVYLTVLVPLSPGHAALEFNEQPRQLARDLAPGDIYEVRR